MNLLPRRPRVAAEGRELPQQCVRTDERAEQRTQRCQRLAQRGAHDRARLQLEVVPPAARRGENLRKVRVLGGRDGGAAAGHRGVDLRREGRQRGRAEKIAQVQQPFAVQRCNRRIEACRVAELLRGERQRWLGLQRRALLPVVLVRRGSGGRAAAGGEPVVVLQHRGPVTS
eukprot:5753387-Prymnesium_polylepis.2